MAIAAATTELEWQTAATYDYTRRLPQQGWAWEFLRRNARFHSDWTLICPRATLETTSSTLSVAKLPNEQVSLTSWGLHFQQLPA